MTKINWEDSDPLCCCEYIDINFRRNHILLCCCNCQELDEGFESWVSRRPIKSSRSIMTTIQDRIRIPWRGGAKQITPDTLVPIVLVPTLLCLCALDHILAVLVLFITILFFNNISNWFLANNIRTKFFVAWATMSMFTIALIFELKVVALLEILPEENVLLAMLFSVFCCLVYVVRSRAPKVKVAGLVDLEEGGDEICVTCRRKIVERMQHCNVCQTCVPEMDFHFYWLDCCIGQTNNGFFMLVLLFGIIALLYSSNLTLTTVCHPFTAFGTVMLPDDCSEVYEQFDMALCFVSAIYSILLALYLLVVLLRQCLLISKGMTGKEWSQMPLSARLCCACAQHRPYSRGFITNWTTLLFYSQKGKAELIES